MTTTMYFKFNTKKEAFDFIQKVNKGEKITPTEDNTTTTYAQPFDWGGSLYVIADDVSKKYSEDTPIDLFDETLTEKELYIKEKEAVDAKAAELTAKIKAIEDKEIKPIVK
jgi:hypothetical protein